MLIPGDRCRIESPAKINLSLSVTGRRPDGFHDLWSPVWKTRFADSLEVELLEPGQPDRLECDDPTIPLDRSNLVLRALDELRSRTELPHGFAIRIEKRIPAGAGLGGGSSNAAALLRFLESSFPHRIDRALAGQVADAIGSDCRLFLSDGPCLMFGRGEHCESLPESVRRRLSGQPIWLICPDFAVSTAKAYSLFGRGDFFTPLSRAQAAVEAWTRDVGVRWPAVGNDFEKVLALWMPSYSIVLERLNALEGVQARLTGSGSALFAQVPKHCEAAVTEILHNAWGDLKLLVRTLLE